ncbi:hypothetical protein Misp04_20050 [Micromonospora sp. NBRC 101691]|nr:hypothetical protein Misp04_20050 [Micromonospora sp. NBRC 101691]
MTVQVRLVVEAHRGCRLPGGKTVTQQTSGQVDPTGDHVLVRPDAVLAGERPDQVGGVDVQGQRRLAQADPLDDPLLEQVTEAVGDAGVVRGAG